MAALASPSRRSKARNFEVTAGQPVTLVEETAPHCTRVLFTTTTTTSLYVAVEDTQGRRLLKLVP